MTEDGEKRPAGGRSARMLLRLTTGRSRAPVDGEITRGEAWLDEAMLTGFGEPIPQQKVSWATAFMLALSSRR